MSAWKWCFATTVMVGLGGCAPAPYRAKVADLSGACSGGWPQLKPLKPAIGVPMTPSEEFAERSTCLGPPALPTRTSVMLYDVGATTRPAQLAIRLPVSSGGTLAGAVDVLDTDFHLLKHHGFGEFTRRGAAYTLPVFLRDGSARYLVISPDAAFVGMQVKTIGSQSETTPIATGYGAIMIVNGKEITRTIPLMDGGKVSVTIVSDSQPAQAAAPQVLPEQVRALHPNKGAKGNFCKSIRPGCS